jgi:hypothetical protein
MTTDRAAPVAGPGRRLVGADGVRFVLREGECCHYVDEDAIAPLWKGNRFPLEACISGWVMLHAQIALIADLYADPRVPHEALPSDVREKSRHGSGPAAQARGGDWRLLGATARANLG